MKRITRPKKSKIVSNSYCYPGDRKAILDELDIEQGYFCAYPEERPSPGFARDIEHFNPMLKNTLTDGYPNWFSASTRVNRRKGSKPRWMRHQPIIDPTCATLETRLVYNDGLYIVANVSDTEANNLTEFLRLNDFGLPEARRAYIANLKYLYKEFGNSKVKLKNYLLKFPNQVNYRRAIETEFGIAF